MSPELLWKRYEDPGFSVDRLPIFRGSIQSRFDRPKLTLNKMNKLYRLLVSAVIVFFVSFPSSCTEAKAVEHGKKMTDQSPPNGALKSYDWAEELELLYRVDLLPCYRTGCIVEHKSTHDPTGGNDDGFSGRYSYIREENGEKVLAELTGPGVINKIHSSAPTFDTLRFYFDGETTPRLTICFMDLFTGKVFPFIKPLSNNEIGGYYTYFPIIILSYISY